MTSRNIARNDVLTLKGYKAALQVPDTIRLNANEAPQSQWFDTDRSSLNRYPEVHPTSLQQRMATLFGARAENLLVTRGSSEAIDVLIRAYCRAYQDSLVTTPPTFEMYRFYADIQGVGMIDVPLQDDRDFALDADAVIAKCEPATKLIFICSPNNPTGTVVARRDILRIAEARRGQSIVVVDEAYVEFSGRESLACEVDDLENIVVLRTLSKAHALAGARCGAVIAREEIIDVLCRVLPPYSFPTPVIDSVLAALTPERIAESGEFLSRIISERERVNQALNDTPTVRQTWKSQANFILVRFDELAELQDYLREKKILIRDFGDQPGLGNCARVTIGTREENDALLNSLAAYGGPA